MVLLSSIGVVVFLFISALVAAAEVSLFSLELHQIEALRQSSSSNDQQIIKALDKQKRLIATIVVAHNIVNIFVIILSETLSDYFLAGKVSATTEFVIRVIAVTFLILLIGEIIPKVYTKQNALKTAQRLIWFVNICDKIFAPFTFILTKTAVIIDKFSKTQKHNLSIEDLSQALDLTSNDTTPEEEIKILKGIVEFGNTPVKQIMKPRMEMICIENNVNFDELKALVIEYGFSRIPIYEETHDQIKGILYSKDLLPHLTNNKNFDWHSLLRTPFFVPFNKKIDDLLQEFQIKKMHLAIVVDEYGGTLGLVTLEDVIEEILGDINDEFDEVDDVFFSKIDNNNFLFEGKIKLNELYKALDIEGEDFEKDKGESDTLAGFILELNGNFPQKGQEIVWNNYVFKIEALDKRRIRRIKLSRTEKASKIINV
jgi:putative hemolysin